MQTLIQFAFVLSAALFIFGLKQLGSPATARRGNLISAIGMLIAIVAALMPGIVHGRQDPVYGYDAVHTPVL